MTIHKFLTAKSLLIFYIFLVSLVPFFWIKNGVVLGGGDDNIFLNPGSYFKLSIWDESKYFNNMSSNIPNIFPLGFFWWSLQQFNVSSSSIERVWIFTMWLITGLSLSYLIHSIFPKKKILISFFAVSYYYFNIFNVMLPLTISIRYVHAFLPLLLALFIRGIESPTFKKGISYAAIFSLSSILSVSAFMNPPAGSILVLTLFFYFIYSLLLGKKGAIPRKFVLGVIFLIFFIIINFYWIWTYYYLIFVSNYGEGYVWGYFATRSLYDLFRTAGNWWFGKDEFRVHQQVFYDNLGLVWLSYFPSIVAFVSMFFVKKNRELLFFLFLTAISIFLAKGTLDPAGGIYGTLLEKISFFQAFREPWAKFTPMLVLSLSVLFGFSCWKIIEIINKFTGTKQTLCKVVFVFITIISLLAVGYPSILGFTVWDYNLVGKRSIKLILPNYFINMNKYFNSGDSEGVVYITPRNFSARDYNWKSGTSSMLPIEYMYIKNPLRYSNQLIDSGNKNFDNFFLYFGNYNSLLTPNFINFLNMLGVTYILQENDILWGYQREGNYSPKMMEKSLAHSEYLNKLISFGKLDVYKIKDDYIRPPIFLSRDIIVLNGPTFVFNSWNRYQKDPFSLIFYSDIDFKSRDLNFSYVSGVDLEDNTDPVKNSKFTISDTGDYFMYINITDDRKVDDFVLDYKIDNRVFTSKSIKIARDPQLEGQIKLVGYRDSYRDFFIEKVFLTKGGHTVTLKGDLIRPDFVNGINYVVFNKYYSEDSVNKIPKLTYKKISSSGYNIEIKPSSTSVILNFAQNFDMDWRLYTINSKGKKSLVPRHFISNAVANGWYLDDKILNRDTSTRLLLEYLPQKYLLITLTVSVVFAVLLLIVILYLRQTTNGKKIHI